jgi:hypothetical protein
MKGKIFILTTGSGAHPASFPICTGALSAGAQRLRSEADLSIPTSVKNTWIYTSILSHVFMA